MSISRKKLTKALAHVKQQPRPPSIDLGALQVTLAKRRLLFTSAQAETEKAHAHEQRMKDALGSAQAQFDSGYRSIRGA